MKTYAPSCTNCFAVARPMPLLPPVMRATFPSSLFMYSYLSDCEDNSAEGATLHQVTQGISRFCQREGLGHDRFDRARSKQRDDSVPGVNEVRRRLSQQDETLEAGPLSDQICQNDVYLAFSRKNPCGNAHAQPKGPLRST